MADMNLDISALDLPPTFYIHFGRKAGIVVEEEPFSFVDGAYFTNSPDCVKNGILCVVVCDTPSFDIYHATAQQILTQQTNIAIIPIGDDFNAHFEKRELGVGSVMNAKGLREAIMVALAVYGEVTSDKAWHLTQPDHQEH